MFDTCCIADVTMGTKKGWRLVAIECLLHDFCCYGDCIIAAVLPGKVAVLKVPLLKLPITFYTGSWAKNFLIWKWRKH